MTLLFVLSGLNSAILRLDMNTEKLGNGKPEVTQHFLRVFLVLNHLHTVFCRSCLILCIGLDLFWG